GGQGLGIATTTTDRHRPGSRHREESHVRLDWRIVIAADAYERAHGGGAHHNRPSRPRQYGILVFVRSAHGAGPCPAQHHRAGEWRSTHRECLSSIIMLPNMSLACPSATRFVGRAKNTCCVKPSAASSP